MFGYRDDADEVAGVERHMLPDALECIPPGPVLAAMLAALDRSLLNGHDLVRVLKAESRLVAHFEASRMMTMLEVAHASPGNARSPVERVEEENEFAGVELAAALCITRRAAEADFDLAQVLKRRLPQVWTALYCGHIDMRRARAMADGTSHLSEAEARRVACRLLTEARSLTAGQLKARLRRLCLESDPEGAKRRYETAVEERRVVVEQSTEGTGELHAYGLPVARAAAIKRRLHSIALELNRSGDGRSMDQLRTDVFLDMLEGRTMGGGDSGSVDIHIELTTLAGLDDRAGEIIGMGPVIADIARKTVEAQREARWEFAVVGRHGNLVHSGTTRRRPTVTQRRRIRARNGCCVSPGCRMPSIDCDIDHTVAYVDGGLTTDCNLAPLCRFHHRAKHQAGWSYRSCTPGVYEVTSPLGHTYVTSGRSP